MEVLQILALQSGDPERVRRVLRDGGALSPAVTSQLIPLLASDKNALDAMHALRVVALRRPGLLIDALLDVRRPAAVRRRLARILSVCRSAAVVEALLQACGDDHVSVRVQSARTLFAIHRRHPDIEIDANHIIQLINREIGSGIPHAGLLFMLLAVIFPAGPIRAAYRSLRAGNAHARGTAREYLDSILPDGIRKHMDRILARVRSPR